jgi:ribosomal-protein-alanine N-acetyltransferase
MVAEYRQRIVGFMIYELFKRKLHLLNFAVDPAFRRKKVGTQLMKRLIEKLSEQSRDTIALEVRERNLPAQMFFQCMGFWARSVLRNYYDDTDEDAYYMEYDRHAARDAATPGVAAG